MSSLKTLIDLFVATPTLANAKKVLSRDTRHPMAACTLSAEDGVHLANARKVVADAKDPAKIREAMQQELRARYKTLTRATLEQIKALGYTVTVAQQTL